MSDDRKPGEYVKSSRIIEALWTCSTCSRENRGRDMQCQGCGAPKDESSDYRVDASGETVDDAEQLADAQAGEHWICAYCEKQNRGRKRICRFCNADQTLKDRPAGAPPLPGKKKPSLLLGCGILFAGFLVLLGFFIWVGLSLRIEAVVTAQNWEQRLHLHEKTLMNKEGWQDEVPAAGFDARCERKQRTTREVVDHYRTVTKTRSVRYQSGTRENCRTVTKNLGNGYAEQSEVCTSEPEYDYRDETYTDREPVYRTEPVYDEFCRFKLYEWPVVKSVKRTGESASGYAWPESSELVSGVCLPCEQKDSDASAKQCCSKEGVYSVVLERKERSDEPEENAPLTYVAKSREEFETFPPGSEHVIEVDDGVVSIVRD